MFINNSIIYLLKENRDRDEKKLKPLKEAVIMNQVELDSMSKPGKYKDFMNGTTDRVSANKQCQAGKEELRKLLKEDKEKIVFLESHLNHLNSKIDERLSLLQGAPNPMYLAQIDLKVRNQVNTREEELAKQKSELEKRKLMHLAIAPNHEYASGNKEQLRAAQRIITTIDGKLERVGDELNTWNRRLITIKIDMAKFEQLIQQGKMSLEPVKKAYDDVENELKKKGIIVPARPAFLMPIVEHLDVCDHPTESSHSTHPHQEDQLNPNIRTRDEGSSKISKSEEATTAKQMPVPQGETLNGSNTSLPLPPGQELSSSGVTQGAKKTKNKKPSASKAGSDPKSARAPSAVPRVTSNRAPRKLSRRTAPSPTTSGLDTRITLPIHRSKRLPVSGRSPSPPPTDQVSP